MLHARGETIIDRPRGRADSLASLSVGKATRQGVEARGAKYDPCSAMLTLETIREAPKALLHDHLDGGLRPETVLELASEAGYRGLPTSDPAAEPADDEEQLREHDPPEAELGEAECGAEVEHVPRDPEDERPEQDRRGERGKRDGAPAGD